MRRTRCLKVVPQTAYNPRYQPDPRQVVDPSLHKVVMRRQWVPKQWLLGADPWEMDINAVRQFSARNLADEYTDKIRSCLGFAEALPYYLEMKERGIPPTTGFMNLYLASAQRYKQHGDGSGRRGDVYSIFEELQRAGAKADINTFDLLRNTLHALCHDYCEAVAKEVVVCPHARATAAVVKALHNVSEWPAEELKAFLAAFDRVEDGENALVAKATSTEGAGYDILQQVAAAHEGEGGGKLVMQYYKEFLTAEQARRVATADLVKNEAEQDAGKRQPMRWVREREREEHRCDLAKGRIVAMVVELLPDAAVLALAKTVFVQDLSNEEVITGSVPRATRTGKAFTDRTLPEWEAKIIVSDVHKKARAAITQLRSRLLEGFNALCTENLHRLGQAINASRIDIAQGQADLMAVLNRYRSSLTALRDVRTVYNQDHVAPLRSEILGMVSLPQKYSQHGDIEADVVVGCHVEDDTFLPAKQRAIISPATARVGLSYFDGRDLPLFRGGRSRRNYDLAEFAQQCDLFELRVMNDRDPTERLKKFRGNLGRHQDAIFVKRESLRRDPEVQRVFTACVERIIQRGQAGVQYENVIEIANMANRQCFLWPNAELNHALLSAAAALPPGESVQRRVIVPQLVQQTVRDFDRLLMDARATAGIKGTEAPDGKKPPRAAPVRAHLADHPVLGYKDSGVGEGYFALYLLSRPWKIKADSGSDTVEVWRAFQNELSYLQAQWKNSVGVDREIGGHYFNPTSGQVEHVQPGDVPALAARWEDRIQKLSQSPQTYDAMFQVMYHELVQTSSAAGTTDAYAVDEKAMAEQVRKIVLRMHAFDVKPASTTFSLILSLCRRLPGHLEDLEKETLMRLKASGKENWWQWFEEL